MSSKLRRIALGALALALGAGLVFQAAIPQPAFATDSGATTATSGTPTATADAQAAADAQSVADAQSAADGASSGEASVGSDARSNAAAMVEGNPDISVEANGMNNGNDVVDEVEDDTVPRANSAGNAGGLEEQVPPEKVRATDPEADEVGGAGIKAKELQGLVAMGAVGSGLLSDFRAGNLISDGNFYYGNALSVNDIQRFLDDRLRGTPDGKCSIGIPGRKAGGPAYSTEGKYLGVVGKHCLANMKLTTPNQTSKYCKPFLGQTSESAAEIISKASTACGISPKVLLVMLEKEQSLVSDTWPTVRQLDYATGANCPDDGVNNTANCDPKSKGFAVQVYKAAQLMRWYALNNGLNYYPLQTNKIKWHEKDALGCGTSNVYIENLATASLYTYTPYRPNQAALNAGWGTGDKCSSYGNRNFYMYYKLWFGSTQNQFPDVSDSHQFYKEIEWMGTSGLSTGIQTSDKRVKVYKPNGKVTREAMAAFLYRLDKSTYKGPAKSPFADVKKGDKFYNEIAWMYKEGLSTGIKQPNGTKLYAPKDNVSREAMAAFIYRLKDAKYAAPAKSPFADVKKGDKFYNEIAWMRKEGLSTGISQPDGSKKYAPKDRVSREAMAAFIYRLNH